MKILKPSIIILFIIITLSTLILPVFAAGPGGSGETSGGFGSDDDSTTSNDTSTIYDTFVPPQEPSYEEYVSVFGIPLVYIRNPQVTDFFVDPSIDIDALLYTNERGYIITHISYITDLNGLSYYFEFEYINNIDEIATLTLNATDTFLLYLILDDDFGEDITPDVELMFDTYFVDMSIGAYIGFVNYFENYAVPQYEEYYNAVLNKLGSTQYGQNMLLSIITAPYNVLDSFTLFEANGVVISLWNVLVACIGIAMFIWFIKMFSGG